MEGELTALVDALDQADPSTLELLAAQPPSEGQQVAQLRLAMIQAHSGLPSALPARVPEQFAGKLDQKAKEFHVTETAGRDCKPGEISEMISVLKAWMDATESTSTNIRDKIASAEKAQEVEVARVRDLQVRIDEVKRTALGEMDGVPGAGSEGMEMDDVGRPKSRPKTRHPSAGAGAPALRH